MDKSLDTNEIINNLENFCDRCSGTLCFYISLFTVMFGFGVCMVRDSAVPEVGYALMIFGGMFGILPTVMIIIKLFIEYIREKINNKKDKD